MTDSSGRSLLPWLSLFVIWIVWGSTYLGMSAAVQTIPPFLMSGSRFFIAGPILLAIALPAYLRGKQRLTGPEVRSSALLGVVMMVGGPGLVGLSQTKLDSSLAALIVSTTPIWMALFTAIHLRRKPDARVFGALVVGLAGIAIMVGGPGGQVPLLPAFLVFISPMFWSAGTVMARMLPLPRSPLMSSALQMLFGGTALYLIAGIRGEFGQVAIGDISSRSWIGLVWLVFAGSLLGYSAYMYANATLSIEVVSTYAYVNPVVAVVLGATLNSEAIGPGVLIGGAIILSAVVFIVSGTVRRRRAPLQTT
ncbi:MAG TPA: EamA family transporter [Thermomicrobiales bacterium]|nr:EamA family transporter [Thermomicrobiales bacterium]